MTQSKNRWIVLLALLSVTLFTFLPSLWNDFVNYDDSMLLFENAIIHECSPTNAGKIFQTQLSGQYSRFNPLVFISYMMTKCLFGFNPFWFHMISLIVHLGCVMAVFWLTILLSGSTFISAVCALLFGIHPIHVEAVAWASSFMHVLYSFFYLLTLILFLKTIRSKTGKNIFWTLSFISFLACGCSFSGGAITVPIILLLLCVWEDGTLKPNRFFLLTPFVFLSIFWAWITLFTAKHGAIIANPYFNLETFSFAERIHLSSLSLFFYLHQIIAPLDFAIVYPEGYYAHRLNALWTLGLAAGLLSLFLLYKRRPAKTKPVIFGLLFFLVILLPFLKVYSTTSSLTNDRYGYLACYGIFLILAVWVNTLITKKIPLTKTVLSVAAMYLILTSWAVCRNWKNGETLWSNQIMIYPNAYPAYLGRADFYSQNGFYEKALKDINAALSLKPDYTEALRQKGTVLLLSGDARSAIKIYTDMLNVNPNDVTLLNNRAAACLSLRMFAEAKADLDKSINLDAGQIDPYYNRSIVFIEYQQYALALKDIEHVLKTAPGHALARSQYQKLKGLMSADGS